MTPRLWTDNPANREQHRIGCRLAALRPYRRVVRRTLLAGRIKTERLACGHDYRPSRDRNRVPTAKRRCDHCYRASVSLVVE